MLWLLIGWQFTLAEYVGGLVLVALTTVLLRMFVSRSLEERARAHASAVSGGHQHHAAGRQLPPRARLSSLSAWTDVAHNFRNDWSML